MNVLILSCGTRSLLVDYFMNRDNGFDRVVVTDCSPYSPSLYRADKYYIVPRMTDPTYIPTIMDICQSEAINAVIPLQEDELILIAKRKNDFIDRGIFPVVSSYESVNLCRDKYMFYQMAIKLGISTIPTYIVDEALEVEKEYGTPLFMKPRFGAGSVSSYTINSLEAIHAISENDNNEFILQPFMRGTEYGVNAYVDSVSGKLSELFILEKIRMRAGETEKSKSIHDTEIADIVKRVCETIPFVGPVDIDIIKSNNKYYVLEINPRFGGGYPHTHESGVNFIKLIANNASNTQNKYFCMDYEDDLVALRYMSIMTKRRRNMPNEK